MFMPAMLIKYSGLQISKRHGSRKGTYWAGGTEGELKEWEGDKDNRNEYNNTLYIIFLYTKSIKFPTEHRTHKL